MLNFYKYRLLLFLLLLLFCNKELKANDHHSISYLDYIKKDIILDNLDNLNFGLVLSGDSSIRTIWLTNNSIEDVEIDKLFVLGLSGNAFSVNSTPLTPVILRKGEKLKINITFSPKILNEFSDSLIINFIYPFPYKHIIHLSGISQVKHLVWISDTTTTLSKHPIKLPIKIKMLGDYELYNKFNYTIKISFDASVFHPLGVSRGSIVSNELVNGRRILEIKDFGINLNTTSTFIINEIIGEVLLGANSSTLLEIVNFSWNEPWIVPIPANSKLGVSQPCQSSLNLIQLFENQTIKIYPNPGITSTNIEVLFPERGYYDIKIFTLNGKLILSEEVNNFQAINNSILNIPIDLTDFSTGSYYIIINSPTQQFKTYFSVLK